MQQPDDVKTMGQLTSTALLTILTQWLLSMEIGSKQKCNGHQMCLKRAIVY